MKSINYNDWLKLKSYHCDKGKHRYRINKYGITWCVICGSLGSHNSTSETLKEEEKLLIIK